MQVFGFPVFLFKSLLAIPLVLSALFALCTMLEVFGRPDSRYDADRLKRMHRYNGYVFLFLFTVIAYFCLSYIYSVKADLSPRSAFHSVFSLCVILLIALKVLYVRVYRKYYGHLQVIGLLIALLAFGMAGTSAGYYLLVTGFGTTLPALHDGAEPEGGSGEELKIALKTDRASIGAGRNLYKDKCYPCHDPESNETIIGPGHKGILKNPVLPVSGKPATPENIARQLRDPYKNMPPFEYLTHEDVESLIAYLNAL